MKSFYILVIIIVCSSILLSCITQNNTDNKDDVTIKWFTCDSTGVPKTVFKTNESFYCAVLAKNISNKSINYRKVKISATLFDPAWLLIGGCIPGVENFFPECMWGDFILLPGEEFYQIQKFRLHEDICPPGDYIITYSSRFRFPNNIRVYDKTAKGYFTIKEKKK